MGNHYANYPDLSIVPLGLWFMDSVVVRANSAHR